MRDNIDRQFLFHIGTTVFLMTAALSFYFDAARNKQQVREKDAVIQQQREEIARQKKLIDERIVIVGWDGKPVNMRKEQP